MFSSLCFIDLINSDLLYTRKLCFIQLDFIKCVWQHSDPPRGLIVIKRKSRASGPKNLYEHAFVTAFEPTRNVIVELIQLSIVKSDTQISKCLKLRR